MTDASQDLPDLSNITDAEALELSRHGYCLAFTAELGWHVISVDEGRAVASAAL